RPPRSVATAGPRRATPAPRNHAAPRQAVAGHQFARCPPAGIRAAHCTAGRSHRTVGRPHRTAGCSRRPAVGRADHPAAHPARKPASSRADQRRPRTHDEQRVDRRRLMPQAAYGQSTFAALGTFATLLVADPAVLAGAPDPLAPERAAIAPPRPPVPPRPPLPPA